MNESVADILREMREIAKENSFKDLLEWCDRIEAAYNRLAIPTPEQWTEFARQGSEIADLKARLREIHDAVQYDCECGSCGAYVIDCDDYRDSWFDGIMKGGTK